MASVALMPHTEPAKPVDWNKELDGARMLLKSGLLPSSIKSPETALFIILAGRDLGLSPVQSLRSINVIQGKVEVAADMQLGLFHRAGGKSQWLKLTNEEAVLRLAAPWLIEPHVETFTAEDAKRAKLAGDNWQKYPKAMLRSRTITAALKSVGFDPTAGMYDYGEIGGTEPELPAATSAVPASMVPASGEGDTPDDKSDVPEDDAGRYSDEDQPVADEQHAELKAMLKARGMTKWSDIGPFLTKHLGRPEYATVGDYRTIKEALRTYAEVAAATAKGG